MADTSKTKLDELRKAFPAGTVGKLPKGGVQLDYVGHAAVTDRLLTVDPEWNWEPLAHTEAGLPALDEWNNLWIKLTVLGVTRLGVGDGNNMKECIGDALRNAAMRFGVALDLWTKDELESGLDDTSYKNVKPAVGSSQPKQQPAVPVNDELSRAKADINEELEAQGITVGASKKAFIISVISRSTIDTIDQANEVIEALRINKEVK